MLMSFKLLFKRKRIVKLSFFNFNSLSFKYIHCIHCKMNETILSQNDQISFSWDGKILNPVCNQRDPLLSYFLATPQPTFVYCQGEYLTNIMLITEFYSSFKSRVTGKITLTLFRNGWGQKAPLPVFPCDFYKRRNQPPKLSYFQF